MFWRILFQSLQQAIRSVALLLFPLLFIAMFAWSTAGSTSGNTSDPVRAAFWLWLCAHLIPLDVHLSQATTWQSLSVLPIGAAFIPFLILRNGCAQLLEKLSESGHRAARLFYGVWYSLIALAIATFSSSKTLQSHWYIALIYSGIIAALATVNFSHIRIRFFRIPGYLFAVLLGLGMLSIGFSLISHFSLLRNLTTVIQPGWVGGVLFLLIQILYLPNLALGAISYVCGLGFTLGSGTMVAPTHFQIQEIPAIPVLASLPSGQHPNAIYLGILIIALGALIVFHINQKFSSFGSRQWELLKVLLGTTIASSALAYLNSGSLLTSALTPTGIPWLKFSAVISGSIFCSALLLQYVPSTIGRIRNRGN